MKTPNYLQKRIDNVKNRYGITITKEAALKSYASGFGASSCGYAFFKTDITQKASISIGDIAIDFGQWLTDKAKKKEKVTKAQRAKEMFFSDNLTTSYIAAKLNTSQNWVIKTINN